MAWERVAPTATQGVHVAPLLLNRMRVTPAPPPSDQVSPSVTERFVAVLAPLLIMIVPVGGVGVEPDIVLIDYGAVIQPIKKLRSNRLIAVFSGQRVGMDGLEGLPGGPCRPRHH